MVFRFKLIALSAAIFFSQSIAADSLSIWIMPNGASPQEKLEQQLDAFTQKTNIPTKVTVLDWGEAWNRISTMLETGNNVPDVLQLGSTWVPYFAARGELKPLNAYLDNIDSNRFVPVSWYTSHIDSDTLYYSIPWFIDIRPVLGNKRIMEKYGISSADIETYKGFSDAIRKVNQGKEFISVTLTIHRSQDFPVRMLQWDIEITADIVMCRNDFDQSVCYALRLNVHDPEPRFRKLFSKVSHEVRKRRRLCEILAPTTCVLSY